MIFLAKMSENYEEQRINKADVELSDSSVGVTMVKLRKWRQIGNITSWNRMIQCLAVYKYFTWLPIRVILILSCIFFPPAIKDYETAAKHSENDRQIKEGLDRAQRLLKQSQKRDYYKILGVKRWELITGFWAVLLSYTDVDSWFSRFFGQNQELHWITRLHQKATCFCLEIVLDNPCSTKEPCWNGNRICLLNIFVFKSTIDNSKQIYKAF